MTRQRGGGELDAESCYASARMFSARAPQPPRRRPATRGTLRVLATLVAVLLGLSSLGQFAHFFLVPHAICTEHGELLELDAPSSHEQSHARSSSEEAAHSEDAAHASDEPTAEHEHCQLLARGQREQAQPTPPAIVVSVACVTASAPPVSTGTAVFQVIAALSLAPKTSPPTALVG